MVFIFLPKSSSFGVYVLLIALLYQHKLNSIYCVVNEWTSSKCFLIAIILLNITYLPKSNLWEAIQWINIPTQ